MINRDDVIRMAREAGAVCMIPPLHGCDGEWVFSDGDIERLSNLIASHVAEECAKVCDVTPPEPFRPSIEAAHAIRSLYKPTA